MMLKKNSELFQDNERYEGILYVCVLFEWQIRVLGAFHKGHYGFLNISSFLLWGSFTCLSFLLVVKNPRFKV